MVRVVLPNGNVTWSTLREKQLWRYLNVVQDDFWPIRDWPLWAQVTMMSHHLGNNEGYTLFCFYVWNGMDPDTAAEWLRLVEWKTDDGRLIQSEQKYVLYQANYLKRSLENKTLFRGGQRIFDLGLGHTVSPTDYRY